MKLAPTQWKGSARKLIDDILRPHFIPAANIEAWQSFLVRRLSEADPAYVVGSPTPDLRSRWGHEKIQLTRGEDAKVVFGDRADATAVTTYLLEKTSVSAENASALLLHLPHHVFDLDKFTRWAALTNNVASAGWLTAHIFTPVLAGTDWESLSRDQLRKMTIRNLHPLNLFLFPNLNKSGAVFADDPRFHALMADTYSRHYASLWGGYLELTGDSPSSLPAPDDFEIDFTASAKVPENVKIESRDLVSKIEAKEAFDLKLVTVNESQGYHSRLLDPAHVTRGYFDIKLEFKEKSGDVRTVGYYRLNLKDLYDKKFLGRDAKGLRLLIHRTDGDQFAIGPKKNGPLTPIP
ncbi:MAG: hypothetical protein KF802_10790 [Bdellovibrionaceae bacterium]|nr:hypothetical protein [Pseudobdellovibrionaceae bacterium]MBX3034601.1 hypothetical protein [Pseudobdellovibrionaceae bacterium]